MDAFVLEDFSNIQTSLVSFTSNSPLHQTMDLSDTLPRYDGANSTLISDQVR